MARFDEDVYVNGTLASKTFKAPNGAITDAMVSPLAGIQASKLEHQNRVGYAQPNSAATSETKGLYVCYGAAGTIIDFRAGSIAACVGAATVTIDLKKNGVSVLSAPITLDNANAARVAEAATITTAGLAVGDWLEIVIVATVGGGTLATGLFVVATIQEDAQ
jgi:hypothetical protein